MTEERVQVQLSPLASLAPGIIPNEYWQVPNNRWAKQVLLHRYHTWSRVIVCVASAADVAPFSPVLPPHVIHVGCSTLEAVGRYQLETPQEAPLLLLLGQGVTMAPSAQELTHWPRTHVIDARGPPPTPRLIVLRGVPIPETHTKLSQALRNQHGDKVILCIGGPHMFYVQEDAALDQRKSFSDAWEFYVTRVRPALSLREKKGHE